MALIATNVNNGGNTTAATTIVCSVGLAIPTTSLPVLCIAYDNTGTSGADPWSAITDSRSNTWTSRQAALNDPGLADAGSCLRIFTGALSLQLAPADNITVTFGTFSVTAKAWVLLAVASDAEGTVAYVTGGTATGSSTAPSVTSGSIAKQDLIVGAIGGEWGTTQGITADTDTTNGAWSTSQTNSQGTTTSGQGINSQWKTVQAAGAQTYDNTLSLTADWCAAWIELSESGSVKRAHTNPMIPLLAQARRARKYFFGDGLWRPDHRLILPQGAC